LRRGTVPHPLRDVAGGRLPPSEAWRVARVASWRQRRLAWHGPAMRAKKHSLAVAITSTRTCRAATTFIGPRLTWPLARVSSLPCASRSDNNPYPRKGSALARFHRPPSLL
jgi:hypothetical protein